MTGRSELTGQSGEREAVRIQPAAGAQGTDSVVGEPSFRGAPGRPRVAIDPDTHAEAPNLTVAARPGAPHDGTFPAAQAAAGTEPAGTAGKPKVNQPAAESASGGIMKQTTAAEPASPTAPRQNETQHPLGKLAQVFKPGFTNDEILMPSGRTFSCEASDRLIIIKDKDNTDYRFVALFGQDADHGRTIAFGVNVINTTHPEAEVPGGKHPDLRPADLIKEAIKYADSLDPDHPIQGIETNWSNNYLGGSGTNFEAYTKALETMAAENHGVITEKMREEAVKATWTYNIVKELGFTQVTDIDDHGDIINAFISRPAYANPPEPTSTEREPTRQLSMRNRDRVLPAGELKRQAEEFPNVMGNVTLPKSFGPQETIPLKTENNILTIGYEPHIMSVDVTAIDVATAQMREVYQGTSRRVIDAAKKARPELDRVFAPYNGPETTNLNATHTTAFDMLPIGTPDQVDALYQNQFARAYFLAKKLSTGFSTTDLNHDLGYMGAVLQWDIEDIQGGTIQDITYVDGKGNALSGEDITPDGIRISFTTADGKQRTHEQYSCTFEAMPDHLKTQLNEGFDALYLRATEFLNDELPEYHAYLEGVKPAGIVVSDWRPDKVNDPMGITFAKQDSVRLLDGQDFGYARFAARSGGVNILTVAGETDSPDPREDLRRQAEALRGVLGKSTDGQNPHPHYEINEDDRKLTIGKGNFQRTLDVTALEDELAEGLETYRAINKRVLTKVNEARPGIEKVFSPHNGGETTGLDAEYTLATDVLPIGSPNQIDALYNNQYAKALYLANKVELSYSWSGMTNEIGFMGAALQWDIEDIQGGTMQDITYLDGSGNAVSREALDAGNASPTGIKITYTTPEGKSRTHEQYSCTIDTLPEHVRSQLEQKQFDALYLRATDKLVTRGKNEPEYHYYVNGVKTAGLVVSDQDYKDLTHNFASAFSISEFVNLGPGERFGWALYGDPDYNVVNILTVMGDFGVEQSAEGSRRTEATVPAEQLDQYKEAGLTKETIEGIDVYSLDIADENAREKLALLKELIRDQRVAAEVGPGNQLESMLFAAKHAQADVVIGIDPFFDASQIQAPPTESDQQPTIILLKGDAWGNRLIHEFFGTDSDDASTRLAIYSQMVAPDTEMAERMIGPTRTLSRDGAMIVLDSGAVERLGSQHYPEHAMERKLLEERGYSNPTVLDWVKHINRNCQQTEIDAAEYQEGMQDGRFPQTRFLRAGEMLIIHKDLTPVEQSEPAAETIVVDLRTDHAYLKMYSEAQRGQYTGDTVLIERHMQEYLNAFGLTEEELQGKRILDIGSGINLTLAKQAKKLGITVVSLNPELRYDHMRWESRRPLPEDTTWERIRRKVTHEREPAVAAIGQLMPFRNESFDITFDLLAATQYVRKDVESYRRYFNEKTRVVAPGGQNNILYWPDHYSEPLVEAEIARLEAEGYTVTRRETVFEGNDAVIFKIIKPEKSETSKN